MMLEKAMWQEKKGRKAFDVGPRAKKWGKSSLEAGKTEKSRFPPRASRRN